MASKITYHTVAQIDEAIAGATNQYKIKDLKEKKSWMVAQQKGQFITAAHLTEYRTLLMWRINQCLFYSGKENMIKAMNILLTKVNNNELVYRTAKGIKGILMREIIFICENICLDILVENEGGEVLTNINLRVEGTIYSRYQSFYLNLKTN